MKEIITIIICFITTFILALYNETRIYSYLYSVQCWIMAGTVFFLNWKKIKRYYLLYFPILGLIYLVHIIYSFENKERVKL